MPHGLWGEGGLEMNTLQFAFRCLRDWLEGALGLRGTYWFGFEFEDGTVDARELDGVRIGGGMRLTAHGRSDVYVFRLVTSPATHNKYQ